MSKSKFEQSIFESKMQIRHSAIVFYSQIVNPRRNYNKICTEKTYTGNITFGSAKRIRKAVDLLLQLSPPRKIYNPIIKKDVNHSLSFITLTIPAKERHLTPYEGNQLLLEKWLRKMRDKHNLKTYVWKAEYQKNGQLHYHITTPSFINWNIIKTEWNNIMYANGMLDEWHKVNPNKSPNSTDVHAVYKCKDIQAYLSTIKLFLLKGVTQRCCP